MRSFKIKNARLVYLTLLQILYATIKAQYDQFITLIPTPTPTPTPHPYPYPYPYLSVLSNTTTTTNNNNSNTYNQPNASSY